MVFLIFYGLILNAYSLRLIKTGGILKRKSFECCVIGFLVIGIISLLNIGLSGLELTKTRDVVVAKTPLLIPERTISSAEKNFKKYEKLISEASVEYDVPASLIAAVIKAESGFNRYAVSRTGAKGLMQIMPATWRYLGGVGSPYHAGNNIKMGTKYLRELLDQFRGNLRLTIAAYNAGPGAVKRYRRIPPYKETRRYVPKVLRYYRSFKKSRYFG